MFEPPPLNKIQEAIANPDNPIGMRMRAAYYLRQAYDNYTRNKEEVEEADINVNVVVNVNVDVLKKEDLKDQGEEKKEEIKNNSTCTGTNNIKTTNTNASMEIDAIVIETLSKGLEDERHGSLLRHEFAYVMGQIRDERSCPTLEKILLNQSDCLMVRHECGEALGAISSTSSIPILQQAIEQNPTKPEISETCSLAISFIEWKLNGGIEGDIDQPMVCACMLNPYSSVDPAPPHPKHVSLSTKEIGSILHDHNVSLFERYRAMFSLRNRGDKDCIYELGYALIHDTSSALLRHEIAYVLGQIQSADSIDVLKISLERKDEHVMVRHESAEALGAIEERWDEVEAALTLFLEDEDITVRESCVVALDAADYWGRSQGGNGNEGDLDGEEEEVEETEAEINENQKVDSTLSFAQQKSQPVHQILK